MQISVVFTSFQTFGEQGVAPSVVIFIVKHSAKHSFLVLLRLSTLPWPTTSILPRNAISKIPEICLENILFAGGLTALEYAQSLA